MKDTPQLIAAIVAQWPEERREAFYKAYTAPETEKESDNG